MEDKLVVWMILGAALSLPFSSQSPVYIYTTSGIIITLAFALLLHQPQQLLLDLFGRTTAIQGPTSPGFFHQARHFVLNNPVMTYTQGEDQTPRIMELLSNHIILGTAYDDSARGYPPRCHPGTRVKILARLILWFQNVNYAKPLLWLSGPAGVGKSAILQTFAETVVRPGASVFISRPNKRNDPSRIFITIASQLAVHIEVYRKYIVDLLAVNPYLLNKSMDIQFQAFIIQPFVEKRIGAGRGQRWAILLDGLDELEGEQAQRDVIRLISTFTQDHPDAPLAWIISSRPEPHISDTFTESHIRDNHESEYIPIDSTEAAQDVERFIRESFDKIRSEFPRSVPRDWPEETSVTRLAKAASGLFIFAETSVRFIRDPAHADPRSRLELVLSSITSSQGNLAEENPFALLDNLYKTILSNIPSRLWQKTKLLLGLALSFHLNDNFLGLSTSSKSRTLRGMAMILRMDRYTVYPSLEKCYSMLAIPPWEEAHEKTLTFLHASFADFLMDPDRSGDFAIAVDSVEEEVLEFYIDSWFAHVEPNPTSDNSSVNEQHDGTAPEPIDNFHLLEDTTRALLTQIEMHCFPRSASSTPQPNHSLDALRRINMITLCFSEYLHIDFLSSFLARVLDRVKDLPNGANDPRGSEVLCQAQVPFLQLNMRHLDFDKQKLVKMNSHTQTNNTYKMSNLFFAIRNAWLSDEDVPVPILGVIPGGRFVFAASPESGCYHLIPYKG